MLQVGRYIVRVNAYRSGPLLTYPLMQVRPSGMRLFWNLIGSTRQFMMGLSVTGNVNEYLECDLWQDKEGNQVRHVIQDLVHGNNMLTM